MLQHLVDKREVGDASGERARRFGGLIFFGLDQLLAGGLVFGSSSVSAPPRTKASAAADRARRDRRAAKPLADAPPASWRRRRSRRAAAVAGRRT